MASTTWPCAIFNVYGPRMDIHGVYTEVLIRWMERIVAGQPPLIFGDGHQTMDFVYIEDVARANILAAKADVTDEVFNVASGTETSLRQLAEMLLQRHGRRPRTWSSSPARKVNPVQRRLADIDEGPPSDRLRGSGRSRLGLRDWSGLVAWWKCRNDPDHQTQHRRGRGRRPPPRRLRSGWVTQGPRVAEFEQAFAACVGAPHACAVSNCTTALHLALLAVGVQPGDEVITVSHSFIATANSIRYCGATPVFVDIEPDTFNLDPARLEAAITERTKAILCVHQMGMPCDLARDPGHRRPPRPAGHRGCRLRHRQRDPRRRRAGSGSASPTATSPASPSTRAR